MASSPDLDEAFVSEQTLFGNDISTGDRETATQRSLRVLDRLATTLGVPVETFFAGPSRASPAVEATAAEVGELTRAFLAITDPVMRRYCLDVVRAAGCEAPSDSRGAESA